MSADGHVRFLAALAERCGWRTTPGTQGGTVFSAPDHTDLILPNTSIRSSVFDSTVRKIRTHGNQECKITEADVEELLSMHRLDASSRRQVYRLLGLKHREPRTISQPVLSKRDADWAKKMLEAPIDVPASDVVEPGPGKRAAPEPPRSEVPRRIVWEGPRDSNHGSGKIYASHAVIERRWSDGSVDYRCSWSGCDYTSDKYVSVASHYRAHVIGKGRTPQPEPYRVDLDLAEQSRREARIRRLAADMAEADKALDENWEWHELAEFVVAKWERERTEAPPADETRELTPEEVIERIARLVDRGRVSDLLAANQTLADRVDVLASEAARHAADAAVQRAEAERLRAERSALRDLLADEESAPARITVT
jgi:hypothetical protein